MKYPRSFCVGWYGNRGLSGKLEFAWPGIRWHVSRRQFIVFLKCVVFGINLEWRS